MTVKSIIQKSAVIGLFAASALFAEGVTLRPTQPTHYLFMPMATVNPPMHLVLGLREISFVLPGNLQLQLSLIDNIGKTNLAAKYPITGNMAIGAGLASTFLNMGSHGIPSGDARLGLFWAIGLMDTGDFSMAITPHSQIGSRISLGADFGLMKTMHDWWSVLWEIGLSADTHSEDGGIYLYTTGAFRISPPAIPFMFFDLGVGTNEFKAEENPWIRARIFFDVMIAFIAG
jgi:hypothetical protein